MSLFIQWLIIVIGSTVGILLLLMSIGLVSDLRELKERNAPTPRAILKKSILTLPVSIYAKFFGHQANRSELEQLINRTVWLDWDIRWAANDSSQGKVLEVISDSSGDGLLLQLRKPIPNTSEKVIFYPNKAAKNIYRFKYASTWGKVIPAYNPSNADIFGSLIIL